jgi:hypothetical protein
MNIFEQLRKSKHYGDDYDDYWSQEYLAKQLCKVCPDYKINRSKMGRLESGQEPTPADVKAYSQFFNVSAEYILGTSSVKTNNINIRQICKHTGLSDNSVIALTSLKPNEK